VSTACGDETNIVIDTDGDGDGDGTGGGDETADAPRERTRPESAPTEESTPRRNAAERSSEGDDRSVRDAATDRPAPELPPESGEVGAELVDLGTEFILYCWDACDLANICVGTTELEVNACYTNCVDDLGLVYGEITDDVAGSDCLDAVVEAFFCETSFDGSIDAVCDDFVDDVLAVSGVCEVEYLDVEYWCAGFPSVTQWFFELDSIGNLDGEVEVVECLDDADCLDGETCDVDGTCVEDDSLIECIDDLDCGEDEFCASDGFCDSAIVASDCVDASDCAEGEYCDNGYCEAVVQDDCVDDFDCQEGYYCESGICTSGDDLSDEIASLIELMAGSCVDECSVLWQQCYEDDGTEFTACGEGCYAEADAIGESLGSDQGSFDCALALQEYGGCRGSLTCDDHYDEEDGVVADVCDSSFAVVEDYCAGFGFL
jgi:hypothetical protein